MSYTISKTTVECYKIRHENGMYWADINIDENGKAGRIQVASDFGNWQNYWGACGCSFKNFLLQLNIEYAADKFGADKHFESGRTVTGFKKAIKEYEDDGTINKALAIRLRADCNELEDYIHKDEFIQELMRKNELMRLFDHCPEIEYDITPGFKKFWKDVWPVFTNALKEELNEAPPVQGCDATAVQSETQSSVPNP